MAYIYDAHLCICSLYIYVRFWKCVRMNVGIFPCSICGLYVSSCFLIFNAYNVCLMYLQVALPATWIGLIRLWKCHQLLLCKIYHSYYRFMRTICDLEKGFNLNTLNASKLISLIWDPLMLYIRKNYLERVPFELEYK